MDKSQSIDVLNDLLGRTYDAEQGYKEAAENAKTTELANMFKANAEQRYTFGHEIKDCIKNFGGTPEKGQTIEGKVHQAWMDIRSTFANDDDLAVLKEVDRGEAKALETYKEVLENLPKATSEYNCIDAQCKKIESMQSRIKGLIASYEVTP